MIIYIIFTIAMYSSCVVVINKKIHLPFYKDCLHTANIKLSEKDVKKNQYIQSAIVLGSMIIMAVVYKLDAIHIIIGLPIFIIMYTFMMLLGASSFVSERSFGKSIDKRTQR